MQRAARQLVDALDNLPAKVGTERLSTEQINKANAQGRPENQAGTEEFRQDAVLQKVPGIAHVIGKWRSFGFRHSGIHPR